MRHYVYMLFRADGSPMYVGMGTGDRIDQHLHRRAQGETHRQSSIRKTVSELGDLPRVKIAEGLSGESAAAMERALIAAIGRHPDGPLLNFTDGGDGTHGLSQEVMAARNRKISATKRANRRRKKRLIAQPKITAAIRIAKATTEQRELHRKISKARWDASSDEDRAAHGATMRDTLANPEVRGKMREGSARRWSDPAERERYSEIGRKAAAARWGK